MTREVDIALNTVRLVLGGTLTAFPDLTFVIAHLGGGIASIYDRIVRYIRVKGARYWTDYGGTPPFDEPYHENFARGFDRLYFDLAGFEGGMAALRSALTVIRPERLLFGTDYPYNFDLDGAAVRKYIENVSRSGLLASAGRRHPGRYGHSTRAFLTSRRESGRT